MALKTPTLTPDLSKRARRELGLSQNDVIKATGILAYKLKQWEGRGLSIELADIRKLSDFYESQGIDISELVQHVGRSGAAGDEQADQARVARPALQDGFTYTPRPGFMISDQLSLSLIESLMERMEANDDRIAALTGEAFKTGFFGDVSDETEAKARELIGTLAENHVIFRCLQGRNIASTLRDKPQTLGDYLATLMQASPVLPLLASKPASSPAKAPKGKAAATTTSGQE